MTWTENPKLYDIAKEVCHENGLPWTDPRTGIIHHPPRQPKKKAPKIKPLGGDWRHNRRVVTGSLAGSHEE